MSRVLCVGCLLMLILASSGHGSEKVFVTDHAWLSQRMACGSVVFRVYPMLEQRSRDGTLRTTLLVEVVNQRGRTVGLSLQKAVPGSCLYLSWVGTTTLTPDGRFRTSFGDFRVFGSAMPPERARPIHLELTVSANSPPDSALDIKVFCGTHGRTVWLSILPNTCYELRVCADGTNEVPRIVSPTFASDR